MKISTAVSALMIASVFSGGFLISIGSVTTNPAPILAVLAIFLSAINHSLSITKSILFFSVMVAVHSVMLLLMGLTTFFFMAKTFIVAFLLFWGFSLALKQSSDYMVLLRAYLAGATVIAAIGMLQAIGWFIGFSPLFDYSWIPGWRLAPGGLLGIRLNSILYEPSQVAFTMGPAACIAFYRFTGQMKDLMSMRRAAVILALAVFSVSSTMFLVLGLFLAILLLSSKTFALRYSILLLLPVVALLQSTLFDTTLEKFTGIGQTFFNVGGSENINATTFTLYFHAQTAVDNLLRSSFLGGGIGSHEILSSSILASEVFDHNVYNVNSAGNLTFRLLSEFGVFGLALMVGFAVYVLRGAIRFSGNQLVFHAALAAGIVGFLIRNGTYAQYGLALFVLLLLCNGRHRASNRSKVASSRHPVADGLTNGQGMLNGPAVSTVPYQNTLQ